MTLKLFDEKITNPFYSFNKWSIWPVLFRKSLDNHSITHTTPCNKFKHFRPFIFLFFYDNNKIVILSITWFLLTLFFVVVSDNNKIVGQSWHLRIIVGLSGAGSAQHPTWVLILLISSTAPLSKNNIKQGLPFLSPLLLIFASFFSFVSSPSHSLAVLSTLAIPQ